MLIWKGTIEGIRCESDLEPKILYRNSAYIVPYRGELMPHCPYDPYRTSNEYSIVLNEYPDNPLPNRTFIAPHTHFIKQISYQKNWFESPLNQYRTL